MLLGDMKLVVVPVTQLSPGMGLPHQDTYQDPDFEIRMIKRLCEREGNRDLTVLVLAMHPHMIMMGPGNAEENIESNLTALDKVLNFLEGLEGMEYANYLDVRDAYLRWENLHEQKVRVRDVGNGYLLQSGSDSLKYQSVGHGEAFLYDDPVFGKTSLAIAQENGIAEWLAGGSTLLGPLTPDKLANKTYRRQALATTEVLLDGKALKLPKLNMTAKTVEGKERVGFEARLAIQGLNIRSQYIFGHDMKVLQVKTAVRGKDKSRTLVQHRYGVNPTFKLVHRDVKSLAFAKADVQVRIESPGRFSKVRRNKESWSVCCTFGPGQMASSTFIVTKR